MSDLFPKEITRRGFITKVGQGLWWQPILPARS